MHTILWFENLKSRDNLEDLDIDGRIILESDVGRQGGRIWMGFICLRIWISGGLF
jgi:hypothetical protein